jgi:hypothetical protein
MELRRKLMRDARSTIRVTLLAACLMAVGSQARSQGSQSVSLVIKCALRDFGAGPNQSSMPVGVDTQCEATAYRGTESKGTVTSGATWTVDDPSILEVDTGRITSRQVGSTIVRAEFDGAVDKFSVRVNNAVLVDPDGANGPRGHLELKPAGRSAPVGTQIQYTASGNYAVAGGTVWGYDLTRHVAFRSSAPTVASVKGQGHVTTHMASGTPVQIIADYQTRSGQTNLTVTAPAAP